MNNDKKSEMLDTSAAKTLSDRDRDALKSAPRSGNSSNPTGIAGTVTADEAYVNRDQNSEFNSDLPVYSGAVNQTIKPEEIDASVSSD